MSGSAEVDSRIGELGRAQPGYLGRESRIGADGRELTVRYDRDAESISRWQRHPEHLEAQ
ncbi:hypothetical protein AB0J40_46135 [Amycolatopsis sp. NPDC049691]|uniref:hypothetical protein n=1 Tax=Amycolatopsis sp. NPDC049691 TaxID=3155155 RepID=UPI00341B0EE9